MPEAQVVALDDRRALTVGGSEAGAACGVDPYRSRVMLWAEKTGRIEREETEPIRWGRLLQPVVIEELERQGWEIVPAPADGLTDATRPYLVGHPDGLTSWGEWPAVLEVKTTGPYLAKSWHEDAGAPLPYIVQVLHYLHLTGYAFGLLACLVGGQRLELRVVARDDAAIARIIELEEAFVDYLRTDTPPPPDGSDSAAAALAALYPASVRGQVVRFDRGGLSDVRELRARREQADAVARQVAELEQRVKARMGEAEIAIGPNDEPLARWTTHDHTRVDTTALKKALPAVAAEYATTKTQRRFTLE